MATDLEPTAAARVPALSPAKNAGGPARRNTAPFKLVPSTLEEREQLRQVCVDYVATLDRSRPLSKDEMERHARGVLESVGRPEGYLGWLMVMLNNEFYREAIEAVPPNRRLFLLPHCLKHADGCPADYDEFGMDCKRCGACSIADFRGQAEAMGYRVLVAEGSPVVMKIIVSGYVDAIVGVACLNVLEKAIDKILLAGIPCMAVPLLSSDCRNTRVDEAWVSEIVQTPFKPATQRTKSFVHLMRAANDMFLQPRLSQLLQPVRGGQPLTADDDAETIDPIASSEILAADYLARGGKYARPFITLACYDALVGDRGTDHDGAEVIAAYPEHVQATAMAMEIFHKASLVHDDIEDGDAYRYGQRALHERFGVPVAINAGDYLIGLGYRSISRHAAAMGPAAACDVLDYLAHAHQRLAEGQGAELMWRRRASLAELKPIDALKIYALKTAPAFEVSLLAGLRLAGDVDGETLQAIKAYSRNLGVAFQILNDIKDWQESDANKTVSGRDALEGRPTILTALALESASEAQKSRLLEALSGDNGRSDALRLRAIHDLYRESGVFERAMLLVDGHQDRAEAAVAGVAQESLRRVLLYLIDSVLERPQLPAATLVALTA